jgi:hypothetical protein
MDGIRTTTVEDRGIATAHGQVIVSGGASAASKLNEYECIL